MDWRKSPTTWMKAAETLMFSPGGSNIDDEEIDCIDFHVHAYHNADYVASRLRITMIIMGWRRGPFWGW